MMNDKEFIDEMYHLAFGASETRHEHTHEEVHARLLKVLNQHYEMSLIGTNEESEDGL